MTSRTLRFVAGIDGGQSSTTAVVVDERGIIRGRGTSGPADHVDEPPGSTKCAAALSAALSEATIAAGLPRGTLFDAVVAGVSGYDATFDGAPVRLPARAQKILHDAPIALAGATPSRPAVVVISGTGSVAYGEDAARSAVTVGGWGYLFGDEGSAYAIARDALAAAMRADDRRELSPLGDAALAYFDRRDLRSLATAALRGRLSRAAIAAFARVVHDAARLGDAEADAIVGSAADSLAQLAANAIARLATAGRAVRVSFSGGAFANDAFGMRCADALAALAPDAIVEAPRYPPAVGAALLAFALADLGVPERIVE
ncbi:MAG TPA: BadF/BadG/BcrA/BcrD ATPase family protein [Candidatus Elarobacter sp.]